MQAYRDRDVIKFPKCSGCTHGLQMRATATQRPSPTCTPTLLRPCGQARQRAHNCSLSSSGTRDEHLPRPAVLPLSEAALEEKTSPPPSEAALPPPPLLPGRSSRRSRKARHRPARLELANGAYGLLIGSCCCATRYLIVALCHSGLSVEGILCDIEARMIVYTLTPATETAPTPMATTADCDMDAMKAGSPAVNCCGGMTLLGA
eukprot:CAMPEP_0180063472 /NCGR_PEP_ID=MMETSP0985-20121206/7659_1 /TAXON_ID=483367 /ORGANISM="non described non described, Strain CCMP 2436" /LENGTH=204 /DNA_ID=CAMNT_0021993695 /DNA_START=68 /DNA_END=679 /DNA_ORIENTATION=+